MFSVVLRPELDPEAGGLLTLLAGTAMVEACRELGEASTACKWPNDVLLDGRKAAGILAESSVAHGRFEHVVLGIGANLGVPPPDIPGAGAVRADAAELLDGFLAAFVPRYRPGDADFESAVTAAHASVSATLGTRVRAATGDGAVVEGEAVSLDERGGLVVRTASGERVVRFGEVEHLE
jgi:BirA family biotin operon repressor/biotin-[acetyl-CoA-carboxylase] ligase